MGQVCVPCAARGHQIQRSAKDCRQSVDDVDLLINLLTAGQDPLARRRAMSVTGHGTVQLTGVLISARSCASLRQRSAAVSATISLARSQEKDASNTDLLAFEPRAELRLLVERVQPARTQK